jgi:hypothetical protein
MSQKLAGKSLLSLPLLAVVSVPAMAQAPFAPPPQVPYGLSVSTESAKNAAAASIAEAQKNNWKQAIAVVDTGGYLVYFEHSDRKCRIGDRESAYGSSLPASDQSLRGRCSGWRRGSSLVASYRRNSD